VKITLLAATSKDGFLNHRQDELASDWTSPEDKKQYRDKLQRIKLQFIGRKTYEAYQDRLKTSSLYRRIIFTNSPQSFTSVTGKLEYTNQNPTEVVTKLCADGFNHAALLGGGELYTRFLEDGLVDEAFVTIEPLTFLAGVPFLTNGKVLDDYSYLQLVERTRLNESGTLLLHYIRKTS
jgi:dihydrofolate reductase